MGIRETLNENPASVVKGIAGAVVLAVILLIVHLWPTHKGRVSLKEFYSDDDGLTWFADDQGRFAPFDHDGKEAVLARVYRCADGHKFVGYLEKFTPDAKQKLESAHQQIAPGQGKLSDAFDPRKGILYKKPHDEKWVTEADPAYKQVVEVHCPGGGNNFEPLTP